MRRDEEDEDEDEEEDEDDRLAYLVGLARACARGRVCGFASGSRRRALDFLDEGRGDALVIRCRAREDGAEKTAAVTAAESLSSSSTSVREGARADDLAPDVASDDDVSRFELVVGDDASTDPAVFVVRPERADESIAIDVETLREAVHGYLPNGSTFDDMHAIVRYPFLGALESSREAAPRRFARDVREFLDRVSRDARGSDTYATARDSVSRTLGEGARCEEMSRIDPEKACRDEDFVGQLEAALSEWCAVLSAARRRNSDDGDGANDSNADGPLREIHAWRARQSDLRGLVTQLDDSGMRAALDTLERFVARGGGHVEQSALLQRVQSSLTSFKSLSCDIRNMHDESVDNVKFLSTLESHFKILRAAPLEDVLRAIPPLLRVLRTVWVVSHHYNDDSRMGALMMQLSDAIIHRVRESVNYQELIVLISSGDDVAAAVRDVRLSRSVLAEWKREYLSAREEIERSNRDSRWEFDRDRLFSKTDYVSGVCEELIEMVTVVNDFRTFLSSQLKAVTLDSDGVDEISAKVDAMCLAIEMSEVDIFNVANASEWKTMYKSFTTEKTRIERVLCSFIDACFKRLRSSTGAFELVRQLKTNTRNQEGSSCGSTRTMLNNQILGKMQDILEQFSREIDSTRHNFNTHRRDPPLNRDQPVVSGSIHWARSQFYKIRVTMRLFTACVEDHQVIRATPEAQEVNAKFLALAKVIMNYEKQLIHDWKIDIHASLDASLTQPILCKDKDGALRVNFPSALIGVIKETRNLQRLGHDLSEEIRGVALQNEKYTACRVILLKMLSRRCALFDSLTPLERQLLATRVVALDGPSLQRGLKTYNWNSLGIMDFIETYSKELDAFETTLTSVRHISSEIESAIRRVSEAAFFRVDECADSHASSESGDFFASLKLKVDKTSADIRKEYEDVMKHLLKIEQVVFDSATGKIEELRTYYEYWENEVYEALVGSTERMILHVKECFEDSSRVDFTLFGIDICLRAAEIVCEPPLKEIVRSVMHAAHSISSSSSILGRWMDGTCIEAPTQEAKHEGEMSLSTMLALELGDVSHSMTHVFNFGSEVSGDERVRDATNALSNTMYLFTGGIRRQIEAWKRYQRAWKDDRSKIVQKLARSTDAHNLQRMLLQYEDVKRAVDGESPVQIGAIRVRTDKLVESIKDVCDEWMRDISEATYEADVEAMARVFERIEACEKVLHTQVNDFLGMKTLMQTIRSVRKDSDAEVISSVVSDRFAVRMKYRFEHKETDAQRVSAMIPSLVELRSQVESVFSESEASISEYKSQLQKRIRDFQEACSQFANRLISEGPTCAEMLFNLDAGFERFTSFRDEIAGKLSLLDEIQEDECTFGVEHQSFDALDRARTNLNAMERIYERRSLFHAQLLRAHDVLTADLLVAELRSSVLDYGRSELAALPEELKSHRLFSAVQEEIDNIEVDLNLIESLKEAAIRPRHWEAVFRAIEWEPIVPHTQLTFKQLMEMMLHARAQKIMDITAGADKELKIEMDLIEIEKSWKEMRFDVRPYSKAKSKKHTQTTYVLCAVEDISLALEDTGLTLQSMSASRYADPFIETVREWEATLALVSNVLHVWTDTQQRWMYLMSIFGGSDDIRTQLPEEAERFDNIDTDIRKLMTETVKTKFILDICKSEGRVDKLESLRRDLEICQKSLSQYLDTKRDAFPRFFFISDEELLSILGASDPTLIQEHMLKLFDNCAKLLFSTDQKSVMGVSSAEGESFKFKSPVTIQGPVESWMSAVEEEMRSTLRAMSKYGIARYMTCDREDWIKEQLGMITLVGSQIWWTWEVQNVFKAIREGDKLAMRKYGERLSSQLEVLTKMVRGELNSCERKKVNTLMIIDVHARDIISSFVRDSVLDESDFAWESQLRFKWDKERDDIVINQCCGEFRYGYEYMGLNGRLVITGLTDRCYITLTTALTYKLGGAPSGPAGTGKTETTKDLAKSMALLCVVFNCGEGLDYKAMGAIFNGLVQCGAWGCFDEFNRIEAEVLSVVSSQIKQIQEALKHDLKRFQFEGKEIKCDSRTGVFITMNPGYAGRTELPDNLKALFRPVTMIVPDLEQICEIMLFSEGFNSAKKLAKKMTMLYRLAKEQLSKRSHYDFGLRALKSVLVMAGTLKRDSPDLPEEVVLMRALRDMNLPKFVFDDVPLFLGLINDLFPGLSCSRVRYPTLNDVVECDLAENGYQVLTKPGEQVDKIIQLYETMLTRHTTMLVGETGGGKTVILETLARAQTKMGRHTKLHVLNPKAQTVSELYGELDPDTRDWTDGLLSNIFRDCNKPLIPGRESDLKYIVFDGDVDAVWVENMNSVMDDNRLLTLPNGERIRLQEHCKLLFEVADLRYASPATVSRCGMVYVDPKNLGYEPFLKTWTGAADAKHRPALTRMIGKYMDKIAKFCYESIDLDGTVISPLKVSIQRPVVAAVKQFCILMKSFLDDLDASHGDDPSVGEDVYDESMESAFIFSLVWSFGATIVESAGNSDRTRFDDFVRRLSRRGHALPEASTLYDYGFDIARNVWYDWKSLTTPLELPPNTPFSSILVSTAHTVRAKWLIDVMCSSNAHTLLTGGSGTSKTVVVKNYLHQRQSDGKTSSMTMNFSSRTTANDVHSSIMDVMDKHTKDTVGPPMGKRLLCFIDDLHMPAVDEYGTQQPIALLKLMIGRNGTYDRGRDLNWLHMKDVQYVAAMGHPGGSRSAVDPRFLSLFQIFELQPPDEANLKVIYGSIVQNTSQSLRIGDDSRRHVVDMTLDLYKSVVAKLLPTPTRFHYIFNLRDLSRLFGGLSKAVASGEDDTLPFFRLWRNESIRVFHDRLISDEDRTFVLDKVSSLIASHASTHAPTITMDPILFADFVKPVPVGDEADQDPARDVALEEDSDFDHALRQYRDVRDYATIKPWFEQLIVNHNAKLKDGSPPTRLVLFDHALEHLTRIHRVLRTENGHALLVGVGGSGKQSLARVAAEMAQCDVFEITLTRGYNDTSFREDLKKLYNVLGVQNRKTMFLFTDNHVVEEGFLESINNMLTTGSVPALFSDEEKDSLVNAIRESLHENNVPVTRDEGWRFFMSRCRANMHVVLAMSPIGDSLRLRCRNFPGLVNSTVIDWFTEWPKEALTEVSASLLSTIDLPESMFERVGAHIVHTHYAAIALNKKFASQLKRYNYVTPKHYLDFISGYESKLNSQRTMIDDAIKRLSGGLDKLIQASAEVDAMREKLNEAQVVVNQQAVECDALLDRITKRTAEVEAKTTNALSKEEELVKDSARIAVEKTEAEADLEAAIPALEEAASALNNLKKEEITEIRSFSKPNIAVQRVCECVMILKGLPNVSWSGAKGMMADTNFLRSLVEFNKDGIKEKQMKAIREYTKDSKFTPDEVMKISTAGAGLLKWVFAMINYYKVARMVNPKRAAVANAEKTLAIKERELLETKEELKSLQVELGELSAQFEDKSARQRDLKTSAELMASRLSAAERLISGLSSEKVRWTNEINELNSRKDRLVGDCLLTSAFLSYAGPFTFDFRRRFIHDDLEQNLKKLGVPVSQPLKLETLLTDDNETNAWLAEGLPSDELSVQNGMLTMRSERFPLCIDPQMQALKWIKSREGEQLEGKIKRQTDVDFLKQLELAIEYGLPFLIENVGEYIDPVLDPVLKRNFYYAPNGAKMIKLGDSEVEWDDNFRLYMTTKLPNPHYDPDVFGKMIVINYSVTELGLEEQLLNVTVKQKRPDLEEGRVKLIKESTANRALLKTLEDTLLCELSTAQGEIVDNIELIETLESAKLKSTEICEKLALAAQSQNELNQAQSCYQPVAKRGSILFFVISALSNLNAMYEYSLSSFLDVFCNTLRVTASSDDLARHLNELIDRLTYDVYKFACLGLFKRDKLALSFMMTTRISEGEGRLNGELMQFFVKGNVTLENDARSSPFTWWSERGWQDLVHLDEHIAHGTPACESLKGVTTRVQSNAEKWKSWYECEKPESSDLPNGLALSDFELLCLIRCSRLDRVTAAVSNYIVKTMDSRFVTPPISDYESIFKLTLAHTPVVFILSPGADPAFDIFALGESLGFKAGNKLKFMALGQGMGPKAEELVVTCASRGLWLMLQNCHLLPKWLPTLEKIIDGLHNPHPDFRLWLTTDPIKTFPIGILQRSLKVVTEPPDGLKMNLKATFARLSEDVFESCENSAFKTLAYVLAFFHAAVQERRKYGKLGWNVPYDFNETDFRISFSLVKTYCDKVVRDGGGRGSQTIPWKALKYLIGEAMYGGRVSDNYDRRILGAYLNEYFGDFLFDGFHKFAFYADAEARTEYTLPSSDGSHAEHIDAIERLPDVQTPEVLGLHGNADVAHSTHAAKALWSHVLALQSKMCASTESEDSSHANNSEISSPLLAIVREILNVCTNPAYEFDLANARRRRGETTPSPTTVVLFQELERHNALKAVLRDSLRELLKAINGEIGMSRELDGVAEALSRGRLPAIWKAAAPPTDKDAQSWIAWFKQRETQFESWIEHGEPKVVWLGGLHCPETYIAALVQSACRARNWPLDASAMYTEVTQYRRPEDIDARPDIGCYISGLYLEGAVWDEREGALANPPVGDKTLVTELPILRLVPSRRGDDDDDASRGATFKTPVYFTQSRRNAAGQGLCFEADLATKDHPSTWILRGVALVLNIDS